VVQAVTGRADFLVDLEAALQGAAVIGAERTFERELLGLGFQAGGADAFRQGGGGGEQSCGQTEGEGEPHVVAHLSPPSPRTDCAMEAGSFLGVSTRPTMGISTQKKPK